MQTIWFAWALFASAITQVPQLHWIDFTPPQYPQMARIASIQGEAKVDVAFKPDGRLDHVKEVSGHPILLRAAEEHLAKAGLRCENCTGETSFIVVYDFKHLIAVPNWEPCERSCPKDPPATLDSPTHITIYAAPACIEPYYFCPRPKKVRALACLYLWRCAKPKARPL